METFSALLALCAGNSRSPVNFPHKGQWRGALMFPLICAWINGWVNNREAGDLRRHRGHYDVTVMWIFISALDSYHIKPQFSVDVASVPKWPTGFWRQYSTLCRRSFCNNRKRYISLSNLLETFAVAVVVSLLFWQLPRSEETVVKRLGMVSFFAIYVLYERHLP